MRPPGPAVGRAGSSGNFEISQRTPRPARAPSRVFAPLKKIPPDLAEFGENGT